MVNVYSFLALFLMTIGVITLLTSLVWQKVITGEFREQVTGYEYSSPIFAFIGSAISMWIIAHAFGKAFGVEEIIMTFIAGVLVILIYTMAPQYLPPSFAILRP